MKKAMFFITILCSLSAYAQVENEDTLSVKPLNEVVVKGEKPQIIGKEGIMVVDLPTIVRDKPVTNILEALGYLPGVTDNNGMIGLTGASDVTIILNGEPTNMPHQNLYQLLYITPIDRLKSVEVMYSAPAKYHVSGAVINIVLKIRLITVRLEAPLRLRMPSMTGHSILIMDYQEPNHGTMRRPYQTIFSTGRVHLLKIICDATPETGATPFSHPHLINHSN